MTAKRPPTRKQLEQLEKAANNINEEHSEYATNLVQLPDVLTQQLTQQTEIDPHADGQTDVVEEKDNGIPNDTIRTSISDDSQSTPQQHGHHHNTRHNSSIINSSQTNSSDGYSRNPSILRPKEPHKPTLEEKQWLDEQIERRGGPQGNFPNPSQDIVAIADNRINKNLYPNLESAVSELVAIETNEQANARTEALTNSSRKRNNDQPERKRNNDQPEACHDDTPDDESTVVSVASDFSGIDDDLDPPPNNQNNQEINDISESPAAKSNGTSSTSSSPSGSNNNNNDYDDDDLDGDDEFMTPEEAEEHEKLYFMDIRDDPRKSKKNMANSAIKKCNLFLKQWLTVKRQRHGDDCPEYQHITIQDLNIKSVGSTSTDPNLRFPQFFDDMFGVFCNWLGKSATKFSKDKNALKERIAYNTASSYASAVKSHLENKFRKTGITVPCFCPSVWKRLKNDLRNRYHEEMKKTGTYGDAGSNVPYQIALLISHSHTLSLSF